MQIHIIARDIVKHDAIGEYCIALRALDSIGYNTLLWAENTDISYVRHVSNIDKFCHKDDLIVYNYSIYDPWLLLVANLKCKKIFYYHGITPVQYVDDLLTKQFCELGYKNINLANRFEKVVSSSPLTKEDMRKYGVQKDITIFPPYISGKERAETAVFECAQLEKLLYCGRLAKHKHVDDLVSWYKSVRVKHGFKSLSIISKDPSCIKFSDQNLSIFTYYDVTNADLIEHLKSTDAFVTFSVHEGFCVPAYLAATFGKPVLVNQPDCFSEIQYFDVFDCNNFSLPLLAKRPNSFTILDFERHVLL